MKLKFFIFVVFLMCLNYGYTMQVEQLTNAGGNAMDWAWAIANDSNQNSYIAGSISGNATFGNQTVEYNGDVEMPIFAKINSSGEFEWVQCFYDNENDDVQSLGTAMGIGVDSEDNIYVSGYFTESVLIDGIQLNSNGLWDAFLAKFNSNGEVLWAKSFGGSGYDIAHGLCVSLGNVLLDDFIYVTGWYSTEITIDDFNIPNMGGSDIYIAKFDINGEIDEFFFAGNESVNYSYQISSGNNGEIGITGASSGLLNFPVIGEIDFDGAYLYNLDQTNNNAYLNSIDGISPYRIAVDDDNSTIVAAKLIEDIYIYDEWFYMYNDEPDGILIKTAQPNTNNSQWAIGFNGSGTEVVRAVCTDQVNNIYIGVTFTDSLSVFGLDFYTESDDDLIIFKLNTNGEYISHTHILCDGSIKATDMKIRDNSLVVTGWFSGTIESSGMSISSSNYYDLNIFVMRISDFVSNIDEDIEENLSLGYDKIDFSIYPNPVYSNNLKISIKSEKANEKKISIYNIKGQRVSSLSSNKNSYDLDLSNYKNGLYFIRIQDGSYSKTSKFLIIK
ncbi:MAG: T9SS type A sorting domain-containing protein [Candidatus Cloacimonetes bacterium]|nr:T9SS type A sorting domain-containing protein [Candidatus Cloacimonadota bacterium]